MCASREYLQSIEMKPKYLLSCISTLLLTACAEDIPVDAGGGSHIVFGIDRPEMSRGTASQPVGHFNLCSSSDTVTVACRISDFRGEVATGRAAPTEQMSGFRAWSYLHEAGTVKPFFVNEDVTDKGSYWATAQTYYWPSSADQLLSFAAVAGIPEDGMDVDAQASDIRLSYTVPARAAAQQDIMVAKCEPVNGADNPAYRVPLAFRHICSAVRFKVGGVMMPGSIERITLSGILATGTYSGGAWSDLGNPQPVSIDTPVPTAGSEAAGADLYPGYQTFMMLPQTLGADARLEVVFKDETTGTTRTLSASISGQQWPIGKIITYQIGISPDFRLEFTAEPPVQDAHYVMCNTAINVSGLAATTGWTLTAKADDGADVSIQREADVNEYARQGFWIDKRMNNGVVQNESVRGTADINGTGNVENLAVRVFIPENPGDSEREITLRLHVDGTPASTAVTQTIRQVNPVWSGSTGWEQIDDNDSGIYGFCYDARHVYVYNDSRPNIWPGYTAKGIADQVVSMINTYGAGNYASVTLFEVSSALSTRNFVDIDYRNLNKLDGKAVSTTDGKQNSIELFNFGGTALSRNFENAITNLKRPVGDTSENAYRKVASNDPSTVPKWIEGTEINESQALALVLKKNRYYLNTSTVEGNTTTTPLIRAADIVWYLPASGQFAGAPAWMDGSTMSAGDYWSSTSSTGTNSYDGGGAVISRTEVKKIRVARNKP